ncbi:MAG: hypothetical protein GX112_10155 [Clostridiaceae bacterium]|jgi:host factor-I protein|nr:hypothetical protein [Clostridiaceae bacterium]
MQNQERNERTHSRDMRIQEPFLNHCRRDKIPVTIEMVDRSEKNGQIIGFDHQAIILEDENGQNMIYKSAMIAIRPREAVNYIFNDAYRQEQPLKGYPEYPANFS